MKTHEVRVSIAQVEKWFAKQGFTKAAFPQGYAYLEGYWRDQATRIKLTRRAGFDTWYKEAYGGAFLVFEISLQGQSLSYEAYCPIWLFGIWTRKVPFKQKAGSITRYRREGYEMEEKFKRFLGVV